MRQEITTEREYEESHSFYDVHVVKGDSWLTSAQQTII